MRFGKRENESAVVVEPVRVFEAAEQRRAEGAGKTFDARAGPAIVHATAVIGQSICIKGEITGDEDLLIEGRVEGMVNLPKSHLVIGPNGTVAANAKARSFNIDGHMQGDINAGETVIVTSSGVMQGNIRAPRVTLQDGCKFKGTIDMDIEPVVTDLKTPFANAQQKRANEQQV